MAAPAAVDRQITNFQGSADEILPQLQVTAARDAVGDEERRKVGNKVGWLTGGGCVSLIASFFFLGMFPPLGVLLIIACVVLFVFAAIFGKQKAGLDKLDLDNDRLALAQELLRSLSADLETKRALALTLCHGAATEKGQKTEEHTEGSWLTGKVTTSDFEDAWLRLGGRLADGSIFRLQVTQETKRKSKPKRKYTKISDRSREKIQLSLRVSQQRYPHLERLQSSLNPQLLANHVALQVCGFQSGGNVIRLAARTLPYSSVKGRYGTAQNGQETKLNTGKVLGLLAYLYGGLSNCGPEPGAQAPAGGAPPAQA